MNTLFEIASAVKTPLALAGIVVVVLYLIFKGILKLNIYPELTRRDTFQLLNRIMTYLFILALIAIVLGFIAYILPLILDGKLGTILSESDIIIDNVNYKAEGNGRINLNGEWVKIRNASDRDIEMTGWKLSDTSNHVFCFPNGFTLKAGQSVVIYTGSGDNTNFVLYWKRNSPVWNDDVDCAYMIDSQGNEVHSYCWPNR